MTNANHTPAEIEAALAQCSGSENYHYNAITHAASMVYTDGVKTLAEMAGAYWLIDAIASHQPEALKDKMLLEMQFWTLTVKDGSAVLMCERDTGDIAITQDIPYTDFPLPVMRVWLEPGYTSIGNGPQKVMVAMLPSER